MITTKPMVAAVFNMTDVDYVDSLKYTFAEYGQSLDHFYVDGRHDNWGELLYSIFYEHDCPDVVVVMQGKCYEVYGTFLHYHFAEGVMSFDDLLENIKKTEFYIPVWFMKGGVA